jgi:protease-4
LSVQNIHSLINGKWFIHEQYGKALLPSLFSIIEGKSLGSGVDPKLKNTDVFISVQGKHSLKAASFDQGNNNDTYVAVIGLKDPIYKYNQECGPAGTKTKAKIMQSYLQDPNCKGIVLDIDSGGGQVSGTPEFYDFIKETSKPVVAYTDGLMCSAAYYIGSAANYIVANKRADAIGSIGVMIHFIDVSGMYEKKGAKVITEYATQSTEKNNAFEQLLKGNPELYIKNELDPIAEEFINDIKSVRASVPDDVFKGGTWNAQESLERKLVDEIGTLQTAIARVFELASAQNSNSNNNNNNNSKKETMSKKTKGFPVIQGILGIEGDGLATISTITGKNGIQISEAQIEAIENALVEKETAVTTANGKTTTAESRVAAIEGAINTAVTTAGLDAKVEAEATTENKITLLGATVVAYGKKPGTRVTTPKSDGDSFEQEGVVNSKDGHNELYNSL